MMCDRCILSQVIATRFMHGKHARVKKEKRFFFHYIVQMHRRTLFDDDLGIIEPLNELGIDNDGVVYTGRCLHALFYIWCCLKW